MSKMLWPKKNFLVKADTPGSWTGFIVKSYCTAYNPLDDIPIRYVAHHPNKIFYMVQMLKYVPTLV